MPDPEPYWNPMVPELIVSDFVASRRFYTEILGFTVWYERGTDSFAYLTLGAAQLMLEAFHEDAWLTAPLEPPLGRGINLQIEVPDVRGMVARLEAINHPLFREPREEWREVADGEQSGQLEFLVQDPDGYLLRFVQVLEATA